MDLSVLRAMSTGRLEFFDPASLGQVEALRDKYQHHCLQELVAFLEHSNGLGELFEEAGQKFVHNMLLFEVEQVFVQSEKFGPDFLVVGSPGVDGILFGLKPGNAHVLAYMPIDNEYVGVANSVLELPERYLRNELRL